MEVEALESIYMDDFSSAEVAYCCSALRTQWMHYSNDRVADIMTELSDEPLTYQVHVVPNQDGENNFGAFFSVHS